MVNQRGFTAIELIVVLIVSVAAIGLGGQYLTSYADAQVNQAAADHMKTVSDAAVKYIKDNYAAITATATATTPAVITVATLKSTSYLTSSVTDQNAYEQTYQILALQPAANKLQTLIVTTSGETIPEMSIRRIAQLSGARGGFISTTNPTTAVGSYGGWQVSLASYGVSPGAGHVATALFFDDGALVSDYLYRGVVPGHPELNRMNTAIDMGGNNLDNTATVNATGANVAGNVTATGNVSAASGNIVARNQPGEGGVIETQGANGTKMYLENINGTFRLVNHPWNAELFHVDQSGNTQQAGNQQNFTNGWAEITGAGRLHINGNENLYLQPWSGGQTIVGGGGGSGQLVVNGRLYSNEYIQPNGWAAEGGGCSPNGLIANSGNGPLFCQSGVWTAAGGGQTWRCVQYDSYWASGILQNHYFSVFNYPFDVSSGSEGSGWVTVCRYS
ncbi:shufflon system plasmid conjugative transfer pilus tip adhesin PilV [Ralstonia pseudosolanacearum]|uniref:shufflon system plasmid conjugative transfer pilus tip adhesin PilV n=1 Tax=Ralstonia pseudosolanacearum TaxID=1310165 RepID=UPI002005BFEB|nr:shufflon system plasmid conjugative transfer pilus tip adhesin PilV [Ralstonia pseudosolanacearum]MCK4154197.1 shufflon system plasmid conjugative transfer pilus tip adhesin PilV [Ralstonia pseudosolanacearum]